MSNPAHRLHAILTRSKEKDLQSKKMIQSWRQVLALPEDTDDLIVMSKVGKVFTLPSIISTYIQRFPDLPADLYLGWRNDLSSAFRSIHFNGAFADFGNRLSDSLLINIRFCAHELDKRMPEKDVARDELNAIRESAWSLYEEVINSDLPHDLARYLLDYLYLVIEAIDDFEITGAAGLERSLNAVVGAVATDTATAKQASASPFGERFWDVMTKVGVLLKLGKTALELEEGVRKLLH
jgi:hypothetical protein